MKKIGVLFGMENSFPGALVEHINARNIDGIQAEFVQVGAVHLDNPDKAPRYAVIVDRISHDIPFYRAYVKHEAINGTVIINNPFWWSADDKFFNYTLAAKLGVAVPATVILPHKRHPQGTTDTSMRNMEYPLDWDAMFAYVGEHGFLKPVNGGGWRDVHHIHNRGEFFRAYDQSRDLCMTYQKAVEFNEYFRCYVVGQKKVHIMPYDPRKPHAERYAQNPPAYEAHRAGRAEAVPRAGLRPEYGGICRGGWVSVCDRLHESRAGCGFDLGGAGELRLDCTRGGGSGDCQSREGAACAGVAVGGVSGGGGGGGEFEEQGGREEEGGEGELASQRVSRSAMERVGAGRRKGLMLSWYLVRWLHGVRDTRPGAIAADHVDLSWHGSLVPCRGSDLRAFHTAVPAPGRDRARQGRSPEAGAEHAGQLHHLCSRFQV